jgi:flavin reductase (DIM6/NTAB) family NADH-FMN oxidoreductase RutF
MKKSLGARAVAYPLPVFLVGTYDPEGRPDAMVAAWGGICSSDPPSIAVSVRPSRYTYANLTEKQCFTVSIPSKKLAAQADFLGIASGRDTDKFTRAGLTPVRAEHVDAPYIGECPVVLECRVTNVTVIGAHTQFIGEILDVKIDESVLDRAGKPDLAKIGPLAFDVINAQYFVPGPVVGKAFFIGKKFLKKA